MSYDCLVGWADGSILVHCNDTDELFAAIFRIKAVETVVCRPLPH